MTLIYRAPEVLLGFRQYYCSVDEWSIGCLVAEMVKGSPLFSGDSEMCVLEDIFKLLGTPNEDTMPGITDNLFDTDLPKFDRQSLSEALNCKEESLLELIEKLLDYGHEKRISAKEAKNMVFV